jgi:Cys-rich four helix bundle protein (predicted Tat secretion target)
LQRAVPSINNQEREHLKMTDQNRDEIAAEHQDVTGAVSRRDLLKGAGALGAFLAAGTALAGDAPGHRHEGHAPRHPGALEAVNDCVVKGQQCAAHCLVTYREGDTTLAECAAKVNEMLPICKAFSYQLAANSPYVESLSAVCRQACKDCEDECRKHEDKHLECKECAEACARVIEAIDGMAA